MISKICNIILLVLWLQPTYADEPNNAIKWFEAPSEAKKSSKITYEKNKKSLSIPIEKSNLTPNNFNSIGIIPTKITGIDPNIWRGMDESSIFSYLGSLPNLNFHSAQTFLKRLLI